MENKTGIKERKVKFFGFYGEDCVTTTKVVIRMQESGNYHAVWDCKDNLEPNGSGWYIKYIEKED